ncbi:hypothetical protein [Microseira wollei]|uniref:hypothetical protein n=1 Tax=Microseira wollei TaxID=467598 RepID=UPI001CFC9398|nr:hypothetical protein [Microseira wollei]
MRKQFYRSIQLSQEFEPLNSSEKNLLQICPVYLHFQTRKPNGFFKQVLFRQRVKSGLALGDTEAGFSEEFCRVFAMTTLEEIR